MIKEVGRHFVSDNNSGVIPEALAAILSANVGHVHAYGGDEITQNTIEKFREHFGSQCEVFFVFNGTACNVLALKALMKSHEAVICTDCSHLQNDECGAPEKFAVAKLLLVENENGKLTVEKAQRYLQRLGDQHHVQPRVVSITQPTEVGTIYSLDEVKNIVSWARKNKLLIHVDGSRLVNAAAALNCSLRILTTDLDIDVISFGGTKNGLLLAEAVIFLKPELAKDFKFYRKQAMQLPGKMRFVAAQFHAFLSNEVWLKNARHANSMAKLLEAELHKHLPQIEITQPVQVNSVFPKLPREVVSHLREKYYFYIWDEETFVARWMTTYDTQESDVVGIVQELKTLL